MDSPLTGELPSLQDQLDAITARTRALVQPDRLALSEQAAADLFASGIEDRILPVGADAPAFTLQDARTAQPVASADLLSLGPVILKFFRGRWDPYCVTELETWRELYPRLRERNTLFVAISPQTRRQNDFAAQQHALPFPILSDPGCELAAAFGLAHTVPPPARAYFRSILVNIPFANAGLNYDTATEASWRLPLPALYLIRPQAPGQPGRIAFAQAHADNRVRPEPLDLLTLL
jgi:peroxiredoxin